MTLLGGLLIPGFLWSQTAVVESSPFCILGRTSRVRSEVFEKAQQSLKRVWGLYCDIYEGVLDEPSQPAFLHSLSAATKLVFWVDEDRGQEIILRGFDHESKLYWNTARIEGSSQALKDCDDGFATLKMSFPFLGFYSESHLTSWATTTKKVLVGPRGRTRRQSGLPVWLLPPERAEQSVALELNVIDGSQELKGSREVLAPLVTQKDLWLWPIETR